MITIEIPCPNCGCTNFQALTKQNDNVEITVCQCADGSNEYEVIVRDANNTLNEKHQCSKEEISECLSTRFKIEIGSINHNCFN